MTVRMTDQRRFTKEWYVKIPQTILKDRSISAGAFRVYGFIIYKLHFSPGKSLNLTNHQWEQLVGKSHDSISKNQAELEKAGYITIERSKSFFGNGWVNTKTISIAKV